MKKMKLQKTTPIYRFNTEKELRNAAAWWITQLNLQNWKIRFHLVTRDEMPLEGCNGCNSFVYESNVSDIYILKDCKNNEEREDFPYCAEQTLVHELLHLKYLLYEKSDMSMSDTFFMMEEHRKLDNMATILVATRYNIRPDKV